MNRSFLILLCAILLTACGRSSETAEPGSPADKTTPSTAADPIASTSVSGQIVRVAGGEELAKSANQKHMESVYSFSAPTVDAPVLLASLTNEQGTLSIPLALKKIGGVWKVVEFTDVGNQYWAYAGACIPRKELWAILEPSDDVHAPELTLLRSADAGSSWQLFSKIKTVSPDAGFEEFIMTQSGIGRLTVHLEEETDGVPPGDYHYKTTDGGKTWTGPRYEPDGLTAADDHEGEGLKDALNAAENPG